MFDVERPECLSFAASRLPGRDIKRRKPGKGSQVFALIPRGGV